MYPEEGRRCRRLVYYSDGREGRRTGGQEDLGFWKMVVSPGARRFYSAAGARRASSNPVWAVRQPWRLQPRKV
jgi:hypothetical protein